MDKAAQDVQDMRAMVPEETPFLFVYEHPTIYSADQIPAGYDVLDYSEEIAAEITEKMALTGIEMLLCDAQKRQKRALPVVLFVIGILSGLLCGLYGAGALMGAYVSRVTFTYFFIKGERVFWFISLILALYIVFPIFYKIIEKFRLWGMLGTIAVVVALTFLCRAVAPGFYTMWEIALCRVPSFVIGIWAGKFIKEKKEISILLYGSNSDSRAFDEYYKKAYSRILLAWIESGTGVQADHLKWLFTFLSGGIDAMIRSWIKGGMREDPNSIALLAGEMCSATMERIFT